MYPIIAGEQDDPSPTEQHQKSALPAKHGRHRDGASKIVEIGTRLGRSEIKPCFELALSYVRIPLPIRAT